MDPAAPWAMPAAALGRAYAAGALSPVEALAACLGQIERLNPALNAVVTLDRAGAMAAARASEARWRAGTPRSALDGVPVTVKDSIPVAGMRATWGSRLFADHVPVRDELPAARLREAGMAIIGKTNVPEFTLQGYTDNALFGPTRNPWDPALTPGGSSGGAVAGVAAGFSPVALGTDGGGSIRRPASHTGLVGLKPSRGRVARADGFPAILLDMEVIGPIARTVEDAALLMAAIAAPDSRDQASFGFAPFRVPESLAPQRILYVPRFGDAPVDPEIAASVAAAARRLEALGHIVEEGRLPLDLAPFERHWPVIGQVGVAWLVEEHAGWRDRVTAPMREAAEQGLATPAARYLAAIDAVATLRHAAGALFETIDLVLTPSAAALPWPATEPFPPVIDGRKVGPRGHAVFTGFVNAAGLPGISLPAAPSRNGLPIGFQLVGAYGSDAALCALAAQYERAHPWADRWPALASDPDLPKRPA